jgi:hypothetical protein
VNHQVILSIIYLALLYPGWIARAWLPAPWNSAFLLGLLAAAAAAVSMRLHLWFTALTFPHQFAEQQSSTRRWMQACDVALAAILVAAALGISSGHQAFAMIFMGAAVAIMVAAFVIEPATARAAFGGRP